MCTVFCENATFKAEVYLRIKKSKISSRRNPLNSFLTPEESPSTWAAASKCKQKMCLVSLVAICYLSS